MFFGCTWLAFLSRALVIADWERFLFLAMIVDNLPLPDNARTLYGQRKDAGEVVFAIGTRGIS